MSRKSWDGVELMAALRSGLDRLESRVDEVNALNVFPVPDGDTGTNMLATLRAAIAEGRPEPRPPLAEVITELEAFCDGIEALFGPDRSCHYLRKFHSWYLSGRGVPDDELKAMADTFDDMLDRSVPFYAEIQRMITELVGDFAVDGTNVYDLGCSTCATFRGLADIDRDVTFVGIDDSQPMLDRASVA